MWDSVLAFLVGLQGLINQSVSADLSAFAETRDWMALLAVLPFGIAFGAIHALTPGHSKTVLASYLAGTPLSVMRGVGVAVLLAFTHVLAAVLIALLALPLVETTLARVGRAPMLEGVSRGILAAIGLWMIVRAIRFPAHRHAEGPVVGVVAGLIPCPLTLFTMVLAMSRGVPEAGLVFAAAMMIGVALTLSGVAALSILAHRTFERIFVSHGVAMANAARGLELVAGTALILFAMRELFAR